MHGAASRGVPSVCDLHSRGEGKQPVGWSRTWVQPLVKAVLSVALARFLFGLHNEPTSSQSMGRHGSALPAVGAAGPQPVEAGCRGRRVLAGRSQSPLAPVPLPLTRTPVSGNLGQGRAGSLTPGHSWTSRHKGQGFAVASGGACPPPSGPLGPVSLPGRVPSPPVTAAQAVVLGSREPGRPRLGPSWAGIPPETTPQVPRTGAGGESALAPAWPRAHGRVRGWGAQRLAAGALARPPAGVAESRRAPLAADVAWPGGDFLGADASGKQVFLLS